MIRDLIIIKDGLPLFSKSFMTTLKANNVFSQSDNLVMISGFFTALNSFSDSFEDLGMISELKLSNNDLKLSFLKDSDIPNMIYLATYDEKSNSVNVQKTLKKISRTFLKKYSMNKIMNWNGEMDYFRSFEEILEFFIEDDDEESEIIRDEQYTVDFNQTEILTNQFNNKRKTNAELVVSNKNPEYYDFTPQISCSIQINPKHYLTGDLSHKVFNKINGESTIVQISKELNVECSQVYNICKNLIKLGFITLN